MELRDGWAVEADYVGDLQRAKALSLRIYQLRPRRGRGPLHLHSKNESVYFVLSGSISVRLGNETHALARHDLTFIPPGLPHSIENRGRRDAVVLEVYGPAAADFVRVADPAR